jgi:hypothetical protein
VPPVQGVPSGASRRAGQPEAVPVQMASSLHSTVDVAHTKPWDK